MNARDGSVMTGEELKKALEAQTGPKIRPEDLEAVIVSEQYRQWPGTLMITCVLTLKNGFNVSGESACASPEIFKEEVGKTIARRNAVDKLWSLLGYQLKDKLHLIEKAGGPTGNIATFHEVATYVGTKVVHAAPMTRGAYNILRGWDLPKDEDPADMGYLVQYTDGGVPNVLGYDGYLSWSPQDVFEKAYSTGVVLKETTFLERMVKELEYVTGNVEKLGAFMLSPKWKTVDSRDQADMSKQLTAMENYAWYLGNRLRRLQG